MITKIFLTLFFTFIFNTFKLTLLTFDQIERVFHRNIHKNTHYDFIIVGSGSAGSFIASELSGNVLLIEAGSSGNNFFLNIPILQPLMLRSNYDWKYEIEPQEFACGAFRNERCNWSAGKILGGSHRLNNMIYRRGHRVDYENLVDINEAEEIFTSYEKKTPISRGNFKSHIGDAFVRAGKILGDFDFTNLTHQDGLRFTHAKRASSEIVTNAFATKILFSEKYPRKAIGIEYEKSGKLYKVFGENIVISAGAIGTPKLLMLSGIGPKRDLQKIGIKVVQDLPVGENLQDHVSTGLDLIFLNQTSGVSMNDLMNPLNFLKYLLSKTDNNLFSFGGCDAMGFVHLNKSQIAPELSFMLIPTEINADHGAHLREVLNIKNDIWSDYFEKTNSFSISILPILLKPKSRGYVKLRSKNYKDSPKINPKYLSNEDDVEKLVEGIRIIQKIVKSPEMRKFGAEINPKSFPGCENYYPDSFEYWKCYIRQVTLTVYHPTSTCMMGEIDDPSTVVEKNFRVKNIDNLFVVDASILPTSPSANPYATIAMLAQKFINMYKKVKK